MSNENYFSEKLEKLLFLEIKKGSKINNYSFNENVYLPVNSDKIISKTKEGDDLSDIPVNLFVEGMVYVLGADEKFRFNHIYIDIINAIDGSINYIKGKIFENIKNEKYEDGYIMLKGLITVNCSKDVLEKALMLSNSLRKVNGVYKEEIHQLISVSKQYEDFALPYYYETLLNNEEGKYESAQFTINQYVSLGGKVTDEIADLKNNLEIVNKFSEGKELVYDDPKKALQILIPLMDYLSDKVEIYYYIAIAYRVMENHEKAIYYLNDAVAIESDYVEVYNELGINYACLKDFDTAIIYFKKVFEVTKALEVCTNLVMCFINIGDIKQAKAHLKIAQKLDSNDEIVKDLEKILTEI